MAKAIQPPGSSENRKGKIHARPLTEGDGVPLVLLHGLLGSSRNWATAGRDLGSDRPVVALDLPDHGASEWSAEPSFAEMAARIIAWARAAGIETADWLGHSLGGKVALRIAAEAPGLVRSLVLADIFPRQYPPHHRADLDAMAALDPASLPDRKTADRRLAESVPDWALRQFLLTNLVRGEDGRFRWQVNLEGLRRNLASLAGLPFAFGRPMALPVLLVYGGRSDFVRPVDLERLPEFFADARVHRLPEAGHNLHMEARGPFVEAVRGFLGAG